MTVVADAGATMLATISGFAEGAEGSSSTVFRRTVAGWSRRGDNLAPSGSTGSGAGAAAEDGSTFAEGETLAFGF